MKLTATFVQFLSVLSILGSLCCWKPASSYAAEKLAEDTYAELMSLSHEDLAAKFASASSPQTIPVGYAVGDHRYFFGLSKAKVPPALMLATFLLWRGKEFSAQPDPTTGLLLLTDKLAAPDITETHAALSLGSLRDVLSARYGELPLDNISQEERTKWGDGRQSLLTDYMPFDYGLRGLLVNDAKHWLDEFREIVPSVWLGRSFYRGKFWCYVVLRFID